MFVLRASPWQFFLFVDESGQDHHNSPYEVLAGMAVEDRDLWNLISALQEAELKNFGTRYTEGRSELKGKKLLKAKTCRLAAQMPAIAANERVLLAKQCLMNGDLAGKREITALSQAKLAYVREALDICARFRCKTFASVVNPASPGSGPEHLRKDYAYLFERFFYFLDDEDAHPSGNIVFDELEKSQSHILIGQMDRYFKSTAKGRLRSSLVIPEPFFVHSDLTTGIQIADLLAYTISWGVRFGGMDRPRREELAPYAEQVMGLRHRAFRAVDGGTDALVWSFTYITDLRPRDEQTGK